MSWFIDAIDVRGGRAVASERAATLLDWDKPFETGPSIFVGPPLFVPEFIRSRGTGFGLARGRAQIGLFLEPSTEVPFPSIDAVAEFVRRIYLRGSSGDGPGESGGGPPRAPEGGPDDDGMAPVALRDRSDPVSAMFAFAGGCQQQSGYCSAGEAKSPEPLIVHRPRQPDASRLLGGARCTLSELLLRVRSGDPMDWSVSAQRLIAVFCRLGITGEFRALPRNQDIAPEDVESRKAPVEYLFSLLTGGHPGLTMISEDCTSCGPAADPFDDLAFLPVPTYGVLDAPDNLQALLSAFLATPAATLLPGNGRTERVAELVLFAACYLTLGPDRSLGLYGNNDVAWAFMADRLIARALAWLAGNGPRLVFEPKVEDLLLGASRVPA